MPVPDFQSLMLSALKVFSTGAVELTRFRGQLPTLLHYYSKAYDCPGLRYTSPPA